MICDLPHKRTHSTVVGFKVVPHVYAHQFGAGGVNLVLDINAAGDLQQTIRMTKDEAKDLAAKLLELSS